jgi:hypothetical protein
MPSIFRIGVYRDRSSVDVHATRFHQMSHQPCPECNLDQWQVMLCGTKAVGAPDRNDLIRALWRYIRRTRFYLFFELVQPRYYPDREGEEWCTPRTLIIPVDIVWALIIWPQNQETTPFDEYCTRCDCSWDE